MAQSAQDDTLAHLTRLAQKPGVQSTLILSRNDGAIVRASGLLSSEESAASESTQPVDTSTVAANAGNTSVAYGSDVRPGSSGGRGRGIRNAEEVARVVWSFFSGAGSAVEQLMGEEDEVRLLRLRTKRNELVVVPDSKFILVVIHDTPPA